MVAIQDTVLFERLLFTNYLYTNQDGRTQQWHNVMIRRAGRQSWSFALAIGNGYLLERADGAPEPWGERRSRVHAYENSDLFVGPSRQLIAYRRQHLPTVRSYHNVGNIWSECVRLAQDGGDAGRLRAKWFGARARSGKVVAWFDTSFIEADNSLASFIDALAWYRDILRLTEEDDDLLMVIKPSKDEAYFTDLRHQWSHPRGKELTGLWDQLKRHPGVHFAGHTADPSSVIAASDLTVTFCFSSPTAEALGARKRAIWYEPAARWRRVLYGCDPLLTAHGYGELTSLVRKLLYEMSDAQYEAYLDQRVKGLVEDFLDGKGLSRFRDLLAAGTKPPQPQTATSVELALT